MTNVNWEKKQVVQKNISLQLFQLLTASTLSTAAVAGAAAGQQASDSLHMCYNNRSSFLWPNETLLLGIDFCDGQNVHS